MTVTTAARILSAWSARLESRTGYRVVADDSATCNRKLAVTNGRRTVYIAEWLYAHPTATASHLLGLRVWLSRDYRFAD